MLRDESLTITDPVYRPKLKLNLWERSLAKMIHDIRDLPFLKLVLFYFATVVPFAIYLFQAARFSWIASLLYLAILLPLLTGPYILMLHNISHRKFFKKKYEFLQYGIVWFLGPFFGETPETYYGHHIGMHHAEENLPDDLSSTMKYQRDSFFDFMRYFSRFFFLGLFDLGAYLNQKKRSRLLKKMLLGELFWYLSVALLCLWNWQATLVVFVTPLVVIRFMMMNGNWAQHAFISQSDPSNPFQNSITCINSRYNKNCFNDGYHIGHHLKANRHWTEMPEDFLANKQRYIDEGAIVLEKVDYFAIWICLMLKKYHWLAKYYVQLDPKRKLDSAAIVALLKSRTQAFKLSPLPAL